MSAVLLLGPFRGAVLLLGPFLSFWFVSLCLLCCCWVPFVVLCCCWVPARFQKCLISSKFWRAKYKPQLFQSLEVAKLWKFWKAKYKPHFVQSLEIAKPSKKHRVFRRFVKDITKHQENTDQNMGLSSNISPTLFSHWK